MGFAHYSLPNGDKEDFDDDVEIEVKPRSLIVETAKRKQVVFKPSCFDFDYYESRLDKYSNTDRPKFYSWLALNKHAKAVFDFYCKLMQTFSASENPPTDLPEFVTIQKLGKSIEDYATTLKEAEKDLLRKLEYSKCRNILKNKTVEDLLHFAEKSWMLYFCITQVKPTHKSFLNLAVEFEKEAKQSDLENDFDVANLFSLQSKVEFYFKSHIAKFNYPEGNLQKFTSAGYWLYKEVNAQQLFEEILTDIKGYSSVRHKSTIELRLSNLQNSTAKDLISYYKHYGQQKNLIKILKALENPEYIPECYSKGFYEFRYQQAIGEKLDYYQMALDFDSFSLSLMDKTPKNYRMYKDLEYFHNALSATIMKNTKIYSECQKAIKVLNEKYEEDFKNKQN